MSAHNVIPCVANHSCEAWIESFGVQWKLIDVFIKDINIAASRTNQARIEPIDEEVVERYALAAENGAVLPPIVVRRAGTKLIVIDGNHRVAVAAFMDLTTIGAYVVDCTSTLAEVMAVSANSVNGERNSIEEQRLHVVQLLNMKMTHPQIMRRLNVTAGFVQRCSQVANVRVRTKNQKALDKLPDTSIVRLGVITSNVVLDEAISVASGFGLQGTAIKELVASVDRKASEATQLAQIKDFAESMTSRSVSTSKSRIKHGLNDAEKLTRALGSILNIDPIAVGLLANGNAEALKQKINEVAEKLPAILKAL